MKLAVLLLLVLLQTSSSYNGTELHFDDEIEMFNWYEFAGLGECILPSVSSSSELKTYKQYTYSASNTIDDSLNNAWVEGKPDYGIGESISFSFANSLYKNHIFSIDRIYVLDGYNKSLKTWTENSRVKKFRVYVNDSFFCELHFIDTRNFQYFEIPEIKIDETNVTTIKFEIVDVFKGSKYKDTAVSSFVFEGSGCH